MPAAPSRQVRRDGERRSLTAPPSTQSARVIRPQPGPQELFLATPADIAIYGGAAGGGKSWALLIEAIRNVQNSMYGGVIFRRTYPQIRNEGGLWDESMHLYPHLGGVPNETHLRWEFPWSSSVRFAHMQYEKDKLQFQGAQIPFIGWDELTHFTESQFFYMLSRNRSMSGIPGYVRATTNPDAESWVADFIAWWIDQAEELEGPNGEPVSNPNYGLPIPERVGVLRWFVRINDEMHWADSREELLERFSDLPPEDVDPKSVTFIPAKLTDNPALMARDPGYRANLLALPLVERERLLGGNWKIKATAGNVFPRDAWRIVANAPRKNVSWVRYWDKAGTEGSGDWSVGVLMGYAHDEEHWYVADVVRGQYSSSQREAVIRQTAELDGLAVTIYVEQEPGSGGKESAENTIRNLRGFKAYADRVTGDKETRARPLAAQQQVGNVSLVRGGWVPDFLREMESFPSPNVHDDQVDAASGAFNKLATVRAPSKGKDWHTHQR